MKSNADKAFKHVDRGLSAATADKARETSPLLFGPAQSANQHFGQHVNPLCCILSTFSPGKYIFRYTHRLPEQ